MLRNLLLAFVVVLVERSVSKNCFGVRSCEKNKLGGTTNCYGYQSCQMARLHVGRCFGFEACLKAQVTHGHCYGYRGCAEGRTTHAYCYGFQSCWQAQIHHGYCYGYSSCERARLNGNGYCKGFYGCKNAQLGGHHNECKGGYSCQNAKIPYSHVYCVGHDSCTNARIGFKAGHNHRNKHCLGSHSCNRAQMKGPGNSICEGVQSCGSFRLYDYFGHFRADGIHALANCHIEITGNTNFHVQGYTTLHKGIVIVKPGSKTVRFYFRQNQRDNHGITIDCGSGATCEIHCYGYGCRGLMYRSHIGSAMTIFVNKEAKKYNYVPRNIGTQKAQATILDLIPRSSKTEAVPSLKEYFSTLIRVNPGHFLSIFLIANVSLLLICGLFVVGCVAASRLVARRKDKRGFQQVRNGFSTEEEILNS